MKTTLYALLKQICPKVLPERKHFLINFADNHSTHFETKCGVLIGICSKLVKKCIILINLFYDDLLLNPGTQSHRQTSDISRTLVGNEFLITQI